MMDDNSKAGRIRRQMVALVAAAACLTALPAWAQKVPASATDKATNILFLYIGPVGDGGWTYAHDQGRKALEKEFGPKITTHVIQRLPGGSNVDQAFQLAASMKMDMVIGTTFDYLDAIQKAADAHPSVKFEHASGIKTKPNLRIFDSRTYEGAYMAGVVAGKMTQSNTLGVVASIPVPEVVRNINAYTLGAQSVNPAVKTKVVWVNKWFDPLKEGAAAEELMKQGADVLLQNTDSDAVIRAAERQGKRAFGWDSDMSSKGPKAHLASAVINWGPYYIKTVRELMDKTWAPADTWWGVKEGAIDLVSIAKDVPAEAKNRVQEVKKGLKAGTFQIFKGPLLDNQGGVLIEGDKAADDAWLRGMKKYVRGVEGTVPQ